MRAREFTEALNRPYYLHWEHSTDGDVSAVAELPANEGHIHILFEPHRDNKDGSVAWGVEFWRNDSQDITGEGDEFRVFATVLQAVFEFVAKYKPMNLSFQATKKVDQGQKPLSRANLYDTLVQRHARASGYRAFRADAGNNVHYELVRINKDVSEGSGNNNVIAQKIFFARSKIAPKAWSYDHVGFITQDGKQIQMSGHKGNDVYITNDVTDDPEFPQQQIKVVSLPKPVTVPTTNSVGAENCGTFVANVLQANGVKGFDTEKLYRVFKKPKQQGVAEGKVIKTYLWHGSKQKIPMLEPRQSVDTGGAAGSNQNAIYATSDPKVAIAMGLTTPGSDTGMFPNDPQMVLFSGKIRKGEYVYLHKLPFNGPDGKPQFVQGGNSREFHSIPGVKGIKPIEIKEIPVNRYLNLIRKATPADLKLRKKYMKQGVAEGWKEKVAGAALAAAAAGAFGGANAKASPTTGDEFSTPIAGWSTKTDKAGNTTDRYQSGTIDMTTTRNAQGQRVHSGGTYQVNKTAAVNVDVPYKDGQKGIATTVGRAANPSDLDHLMGADAVAKRKGVDPKAFARFQQGLKEQGIPEGAMKDLDIDIQDQQWDAIVGYVVNGVKKNMDIGTMELNLYKWGGKEMFDVDQELEDRGFRNLADLVNHIKQHGGRYQPPTDFGLGVAENFADGKKPGRKGLAKRVGVNCKQPVSKLRSIAKNSSGERQRMAHWCANMKSGKNK
jgi:hypothetical protein